MIVLGKPESLLSNHAERYRKEIPRFEPPEHFQERARRFSVAIG